MKSIKERIEVASGIANNNPTVDIDAGEIIEILKLHSDKCSSIMDAFLYGLYKGINAGTSADSEKPFAEIPLRANELMIKYFDDEQRKRMSELEKRKVMVMTDVMFARDEDSLKLVERFIEGIKR